MSTMLIATTEQRPKLDDFDDHIFIIQKVLTYDHVESQLSMEQVSFVLGPNSVISFQENSEDDIFKEIGFAVKECDQCSYERGIDTGSG